VGFILNVAETETSGPGAKVLLAIRLGLRARKYVKIQDGSIIVIAMTVMDALGVEF
jgi:hypothetical protein